MTSVQPAPATSAAGIGYRPGLDGLRGLALLAIVIYHSGLGWAPGAFLSVSTFFTLSGFLITAVMLGERAKTGRISLRRFWNRRLRRLLPAALLAITAIVLASAALADSTQLSRLRADAASSLLYVANWRFISVGDAYGATFSTPSPFTHFWTLSIEEQFYVAFPLLLVGVLAIGRGRPKAVGLLLAALALVSVVWSVVLMRGGATTDRVYFGTDTRAAELLTGAVLAVWWTRRPDPVPAGARRWVRGAGAGALLAVVALWVTASLGQRAYYQGGLALYSLLTVAVLAAVMEGGVVARVLSARPLVALGVVSYGAYLYHWPILVWLEVHTELTPLGRFALGLPVTLAAAVVSHRFVEQPIREGRLVRPSAARWVGTAAMASVAILVVAVSWWRPAEETYDFATARDTGGASSLDPEALGAEEREQLEQFFALSELRERLAASGAPTVATFGDSTALLNGTGLSTWAETSFAATGEATLDPRRGWAELGCGLIDDGERRQGDRTGEQPAACRDWPDHWAAAAAESTPQLAVVMLGAWDVFDLRPPGFDGYTAIGDPQIDDVLREQIRRGIDALAPHTDVVVLTLSPPVEVGRVDGRSPEDSAPENDPARMRRFNDLLREAAAADPSVATLDFTGWLAERGDERDLRPDGVHLTEEGALLAAEWMGPELARIHARWEAQA